MVYLGTCSPHLLKACRRGPLQWPGLRCAGQAGLILKLARLAHQDYCEYAPTCSIQRLLELQIPGTGRHEAGGVWHVAGGG